MTVSNTAPLPATAELGLRLLITGSGLGRSTVKLVLVVAEPAGVVTLSSPDVAPVGTTKRSVASSMTVKPPTLVPLSATVAAPVRLVPVTVTVVPTRPLAGAKLSNVGAGVVTANVVGAEVPPPGKGFVTSTS